MVKGFRIPHIIIMKFELSESAPPVVLSQTLGSFVYEALLHDAEGFAVLYCRMPRGPHSYAREEATRREAHGRTVPGSVHSIIVKLVILFAGSNQRLKPLTDEEPNSSVEI
jgi:hypothetical protein